jgi:hypothetical protein
MEVPVKKLIYRSILVLLLGASGALAQQPVIKSTMPDGKIVYGEKPAPGAAKVETIEVPPAKTGVSTALTQEEKARAAALSKERALATAREAQQQDRLAEARKAVTDAEAALAKGKEPLPGERIGLAGGGSRLSEAYFARQKSLEDAVAAARKRLADAERGGGR